jgi:hypothetical protein
VPEESLEQFMKHSSVGKVIAKDNNTIERAIEGGK